MCLLVCVCGFNFSLPVFVFIVACCYCYSCCVWLTISLDSLFATFVVVVATEGASLRLLATICD